jgi:hypothetical protein
MAQMNALIPLSGKPFDLGNALAQGIQVGNALSPQPEQMTEYQKAQLMLELQKLEALKASGGMTPAQREGLDIQRERLGLEREKQKAGGPPPVGFRWSQGQQGALEAIPGGPATRIPAETAGRVAMIDTALSDFSTARNVMEGEWGAKGAAQSVLGMGEVGRAQRQVRSLIEASLRAMTGAAAPEQEVARYMDLYMPNAADTAETARQKLDLLTSFATNAKSLITQGRGEANTTQEASSANTTGGNQAVEGQVYENDAGEKIIFRNGRFEPYR